MSNPKDRRSERISTSFSALVKYQESEKDYWKETAQTISVSRIGAGFFLQRKCQIGRLLSIIIPLPRHLRCYDDEKELYRIWGLVQHCSAVKMEETSVYHVGVAFVGKDVPSGFKDNPTQSYKICGVTEDGLWEITATEKPFLNRKNPRFWASLEVTLEILDPEAEADDLTRENTITQNISVCGAAVYSNLNLNVDDRLQFKSKAHDFSALAAVRFIQTETDERPIVHLEFLDAEFPIEKIVLPFEDEPEISRT